jgi:glycosyltransferase involved in cell wall biosynthesis
MRVLMVSPAFYPIKGGTETVVRTLSIRLNEIGVHTDVLTFNQDEKFHPKWNGKIEKIDGITVFKIPGLNLIPKGRISRITLGVHLIPGARFAHIMNQYDIIHFHEQELSFPFFSYLIRKPKVLHLHKVCLEYFKRYHLSRMIFKTVADKYICLTKEMKAQLIKLGFPETKLVHLPNSVDIHSLFPQGEKEENLLLYVGRMFYEKGVHVLLRSLRYIKKPVRLILIGPMEPSGYCQNLLKLIEKQNRETKHEIKYLGALPPGKSITQWYQKATMLITPSLYETFGIVILEAFACETPVVASNVGGIPEIIKNHENGLLVPPQNPLKLAEAIQYLLDNKDIRIRMGREGRELVKKVFSLEVNVKNLYTLYQNLISY